MDPAIIAAALSVLAVILAFFGFRSLKRKRVVVDTPTSKTAAVFIGPTEVKGRARARQLLTSYLAELPCVYYSFTVAEKWSKTERYRDSEGNWKTRRTSGWKTVRTGTQLAPFDLLDDTGAIRVLPQGANITGEQVFSQYCGRFDPLYYSKGPMGAVAHSDHKRRFTETAIPIDQELYILGTARLRDDIVAPEICKGQDRDYIISTKGEEGVVKGLNVAVVLLFLFAAVAWVGASTQLTDPGGFSLMSALFIFGGVFAALAAYAVLIYNGLINVRNNVDHAKSLIDIQLKRRFDLIPQLVDVAAGYAKYEGEVHASIATLRSKITRGDDADTQTRHLGKLFAVVEAYPDIKADASFGKLMEELTRTEDVIALARTFYNDSVTSLKNRLQVFPDGPVATLFRFEVPSLFEIDAFEAKPVTITFDEEPDDQLADPTNAFDDDANLEAPPLE